MPKAVRILVYDAPTVDKLDKQLGASLPDGLKVWNVDNSINVLTLPGTYKLWRLFRFLWSNLL